MPVFRVDRRERRKAIPGFGGRYEVGDLGKVYSGGCEMSLIRGRYVNLCWQGRTERRDVAYLVAQAFLSNLKGFEWVRHKDGNLENNRVENLEWAPDRTRRGGRRVAGSRAVTQYDLDGHYLRRFESLRQAEQETGVARNLIRDCAEGRARRAKKWIFRYE